MRIALDVRYRVSSGASTYIHALVPALIASSPPGSAFFYVRYRDQVLPDLPDLPAIDAPRGSPARDLLWTNHALHPELSSLDIDLYHGLKLFGPLRTDIPMVHTVHSITRPLRGEFPMSLRQRTIHEYGNSLFRRSCRVIGVSGYVSDFLVEDLGLERQRVRTVELGVPEAFRVAVETLDRSQFDASRLNGAPYFVCVGNVEQVKNHATAVRALGRLRDKVQHHLIVAGRTDSAAKAELQALIDSEGLGGRVHLIGFLALPALVACLAGADLQLHPSLSEGFCLAVIEGMYAGVPIIASDVPGIRDVMGDTGRTIADPQDDRALADAILDWISHPADAQAAAARAQARAARFTWEEAARQTLAVYDECVES